MIGWMDMHSFANTDKWLAISLRSKKKKERIVCCKMIQQGCDKVHDQHFQAPSPSMIERVACLLLSVYLSIYRMVIK